MKADPALGLRLGAALFLFSVVVGGTYLIGSAQSFYDETLLILFTLLKWLAWGGLLFTWIVLVPWTRKGKRLAWACLLGSGFAVLFALVLVWGGWIYPAGLGLW